MENKWFTIYWLGGDKTHVFGPSIEVACQHAGIGGGAARAIDWYDDKGISSTYYYDKQQKSWVPYKQVTIKKDNFDQLGLDDLLKFMDTHDTIIVEFPNKDQVLLRRDWGHFLLNEIGMAWVEYVEVSFGEYFEGKYGGYEDGEEPGEDDHYFMSANGQYFAPVDLPHAMEAFARRVKTEPFRSVDSQYTATMEEIHSKQKVSYEG